MNRAWVQLRKELGLLRSAWGAAAVLAGTPLVLGLLPDSRKADAWPLTAVLLFVGLVVLGTGAVVQEYGYGTFPTWLTQPVARRRLWWGKMVALGLAATSVLGIHTLAVGLCRALGDWELPDGSEVIVGGMLVTALGFSQFFAMWTRQGTAVFWLSALVPLGLMGAMAIGVDQAERSDLGMTPQLGEWLIGGTPPVGALVSWFFAYRRFLRLEDLALLDREVPVPSLPGWIRGVRRRTGFRLRTGSTTGVAGGWRRRSAGVELVLKELRLQYINGVLVLGLTLTMAVLILTLQFRRSEVWLLEAFWVLWMLGSGGVPVLVGAGAVAEERRLGVHTWQLMQPVSSGRQWRAKVGVCFLVAFVLGVAVPSLIERVLFFDHRLGAGHEVTWASRLLIWIISTTLGLYASTLSNHLIQALSLTAFLALAGAAAALGFESVLGGAPTPLPLCGGLGLCLLTPLLLLLGRWNFRALRIDGRRWLGNLGAVLAGMAVVALGTVGARNRVWEWMEPTPAARSALAVRAGVRAQLLPTRQGVVVLTPDGRLWRWAAASGPSDLAGLELQPKALGQGTWTDAAASDRVVAAVRSDGTLWAWGEWPHVLSLTSRVPVMRWQVPVPGPVANRSGAEGSVLLKDWDDTGPRVKIHLRVRWERLDRQPTQIGRAADWVGVGVGEEHVVAVKRDGTVWGWGSDQHGQMSGAADGEGGQEVPLAGGTHCVLVAAAGTTTLGAREDGSVWAWSWQGTPPSGFARSGEPSVPGPHPLLPGGPEPLRLGSGAFAVQAIGADGVVRVRGRTPQFLVGLEAADDPVRLGDKPVKSLAMVRTEWAGWEMTAVGMDGALWRWTYPPGGVPAPEGVLAPETGRRVGSRSEWVAVAPLGDSLFGLTADGGLWTWVAAWGTPWWDGYGRREPPLVPWRRQPWLVGYLGD